MRPLAADLPEAPAAAKAATPGEVSLFGRLAKGSVWALTGSLATQLSALLFSVLAARLLAPAAFGQLGLLQTTIGTFGVFAGMGLGLTTTRYLAALWRSDPARAGRILAMTEAVVTLASVTVAAVVLMLAPALARSILNAPELVTPLRLAVGVLLFSSLNAVQAGALAGLEAFRALAINNLWFSGVSLTAASLGVWQWGAEGAMAGLALAHGSVWLANRAAVRRYCLRRGIEADQRPDWREASIFGGFTLPAILSTAMLTPVIWIATTMLARSPGGYAEVALFIVAHQWRAVTVFLSNIVAQPTLALLPELHERGDGRGFRQILRTSILVNVLTGAAAGLAIVAGADWIASFYGAAFAEAQTPIRYLIAASILNCYTSAIGNALASVGRMWLSTGLNAMWALLLLAGTAALAPRMGATGLAVSFLISYLALAVAGTAAAWKPLFRWRPEGRT